MDQASGLVAMRLYVTRDKGIHITPPFHHKPASDIKRPDDDSMAIPNNLTPFVRTSRPNLAGLVEQAADEAVTMGRLGVAACGSRSLVTDIKNAAAGNLRSDMPDIYCHAEEFDY
jgi:hypothetical protein